MKINERDWAAFLEHLNATLDAFHFTKTERGDVVVFVESTKFDIVEV